ncbi:MAG: FIST N-terminal domain-containing protein [Phycisphaerae bacterium]|nr:FIST N-terminal domain-containing protein [Phycisphaerae bacterium]
MPATEQPSQAWHPVWIGIRRNIAMLAVATAGLVLAGCSGPPPGGYTPAGPETRSANGGLQAGFGWSSTTQPGEAAREAVQAALAPLGRTSPEIVLVWDNWRSREDARAGLAAINREVGSFAVYGGHSAWPVSARGAAGPSVSVLALGGGWGAAATSVGSVSGREAEAAGALVDILGVGPRPDVTPPATATPDGLAVIVFGDLSGRQADKLITELAKRVDRRAVVFGGGGSGAAGSGWQYVGGRIVSDSVWALRLAGPFRASAVELPAQADSDAINQACSLGAAILDQDLGRARTGRPLLLMTLSSGLLGSMADPQHLAAAAAERLGRGAVVCGWSGEAQIGPDAKSGALSVGRFNLAMALIVPQGAAPTSQPTSRPLTQAD